MSGVLFKDASQHAGSMFPGDHGSSSTLAQLSNPMKQAALVIFVLANGGSQIARERQEGYPRASQAQAPMTHAATLHPLSKSKAWEKDLLSLEIVLARAVTPSD